MKKVYEVRMENWEYRNRKNNLTTKQLADHACYCGGNCLGDTYNVIGRFNTLEEALKLFEKIDVQQLGDWSMDFIHTLMMCCTSKASLLMRMMKRIMMWMQSGKFGIFMSQN